MRYRDFDDRKVRVTLKTGEVFEGYSTSHSKDYNEHEFNRAEPGIQICDYLFFKSEIKDICLLPRPSDLFEAAEEDFMMHFALKRLFSEHLWRFEDNELPDRHSFNFFEYYGQPSFEEIKSAIAFQKERNDCFLKLFGREPLKDSFGLSPSVTLTMQLFEDPAGWELNPELEFYRPSIFELEELEISHYGPLYGENFSRRNIRHLFEELSYHGAYLDNELVASCYTFSFENSICLDGLLVDMDHRGQKIATTMLAHIADMAKGRVIFLHADAEESPRRLYEKLGFREVKRSFEYLKTNL